MSLLNRAGALRRNAMDALDTTRIDRAVNLFELAGRLTGYDSTIQERLGDALTARGIYKANKLDPPAAVADLARAFRLTPRDHHTRDQYARALGMRAVQLRNEEDREEDARRMFERARALVEEGQKANPHYGDYQETLGILDRASRDVPDGQAFVQLDEVLGPLSEAPEDSPDRLWPDLDRAKAAGDVPRALDIAERLWQRSPDDREVQQELVSIVTQRAEEVLATGAEAEYSNFVADWRARFGTSVDLSRSIPLLELGPRLRHYLSERDLKYMMLPDGTFSLLFDSHELGSVRVLVTIEGELIKVSVPVRQREDAREGAVLVCLLQHTSETPFFRAVRIPRPPSLGLLCRTPGRYLTAPLLEYLVRSASRFASVEPSLLTDGPRLRSHFGTESGTLRLLLEGREQFPLSLAPLEQICTTRGWEVLDRSNLAWTIRGEAGGTRVEQMAVGVRLWAGLGRPTAVASPDDVFAAMADLNYELSLGKLIVTSDGAVHFVCELPRLDGAGVDQAMRQLGEQSPAVRSRLGLTD